MHRTADPLSVPLPPASPAFAFLGILYSNPSLGSLQWPPRSSHQPIEKSYVHAYFAPKRPLVSPWPSIAFWVIAVIKNGWQMGLALEHKKKCSCFHLSLFVGAIQRILCPLHPQRRVLDQWKLFKRDAGKYRGITVLCNTLSAIALSLVPGMLVFIASFMRFESQVHADEKIMLPSIQGVGPKATKGIVVTRVTLDMLCWRHLRTSDSNPCILAFLGKKHRNELMVTLQEFVSRLHLPEAKSLILRQEAWEVSSLPLFA